MNTPSTVTRREFLRRTSRLAALGAAAPMALDLMLANAAAAQTDPDDYRALVCVFLFGGNDGYNTVIPYTSSLHREYTARRPTLAASRADLGPTRLGQPGSWPAEFALHPSLSALMPIWGRGNLSTGFRVGTLLAPTTVADFNNGQNLPPKLFSHNDQFTIWQSMAAEGAATGWGGRAVDLLASANGAADLVSAISVGSSSVFLTGAQTSEYAISSAGPVEIASVGNAQADALIKQSLQRRRSDPFRSEVRDRYRQAVAAGDATDNIIASVPTPPMPATGLGQDLAMTARIISGHRNSSVKRQVFFVALGGFDTHASQLDRHPRLMATLGDAMAGFHNALEAEGMLNQVTTFTASDFGRTLTPNSKVGTDHGWGSSPLVMGGAVADKSWFGEIPTYTLGANDDVGQGRLLPAVSVDQYGADLCRWFGVPNNMMSTVFRNVSRFDTSGLGFLN